MFAIIIEQDGQRGVTLVITNEDLSKLLDGKACILPGTEFGFDASLVSVAVAYVPTSAEANQMLGRLQAVAREANAKVLAGREHVDARRN
jgi:hypothetical protein